MGLKVWTIWEYNARIQRVVEVLPNNGCRSTRKVHRISSRMLLGTRRKWIRVGLDSSSVPGIHTSPSVLLSRLPGTREKPNGSSGTDPWLLQIESVSNVTRWNDVQLWCLLCLVLSICSEWRLKGKRRLPLLNPYNSSREFTAWEWPNAIKRGLRPVRVSGWIYNRGIRERLRRGANWQSEKVKQLLSNLIQPDTEN